MKANCDYYQISPLPEMMKTLDTVALVITYNPSIYGIADSIKMAK